MGGGVGGTIEQYFNYTKDVQVHPEHFLLKTLLKVELTQLRQPLQNAPPPDVTNPVSEPDVAR